MARAHVLIRVFVTALLALLGSFSLLQPDLIVQQSLTNVREPPTRADGAAIASAGHRMVARQLASTAHRRIINRAEAVTAESPPLREATRRLQEARRARTS